MKNPIMKHKQYASQYKLLIKTQENVKKKISLMELFKLVILHMGFHAQDIFSVH